MKKYGFIFISILLGAFTAVRILGLLQSFGLAANLPALAAFFAACSLFWGVIVIKFRLMERYQSKWFCLGAVLGSFFDFSYLFCSMDQIAGKELFSLLAAGGNGIFLAAFLTEFWKAFAACFPKHTGSKCWLLWTALVCNLGVAIYLSNSSNTYCWDTAGYWMKAKEISETLFTPGFLKTLVSSVYFDDYNDLLALPIGVLMKVFGTSRLVFVLGIVNCYLLPAIWVLYQMSGRKEGRVWIILLFTPALFYLTVTGFADIGAMAVALTAVAVFQKQGLPRQKKNFVIGALCAFSFVLRRYFLFFALSFGGCVFIGDLIAKRWRKAWVLPAAGGFVGIFFMQPFLTEKLLKVNYQQAYHAYALGLKTDYFLFVRYFGILILAAIIAGGVYLWVKKQKKAVVLLIAPVVCFFAFTRVQTHGQQHLLLYLPFLLGLWTMILDRIKKKQAVALFCCAALVTGWTLRREPQPQNISEISRHALLPDFTFEPKVRKDMVELVRMKGYLDGLAQDTEAKVAVLASSFTLNRDLLEKLYWSLGVAAPQHQCTLLPIPEVDSRDGKAPIWQQADYVVVADPVQTHLDPSLQQAVAAPAEAFLNGNFAENYQKMPESFQLENSVVFLYKKIH